MNKNVLLVEYDISTIDEIKNNLHYSSISLKTVEDGLKAKEELKKEDYDLVITAAMLPKFHGFQLTEFITSEYSHIKTVIISSIYKEVDYKHQAITQFGAIDFFEKPLNIEKFKKKILEILNIDPQTLNRSHSNDNNDILDTNKMPIYNDFEDKKKLTSDDIFGDIIKDVENSGSNEDILPDKIEKRAQTIKKSDDISKTNIFDLNILDELLKKPVKTKTIKKNNDKVSRQLEETLSGLGIDINKSKNKISESKIQSSVDINISNEIETNNDSQKTIIENSDIQLSKIPLETEPVDIDDQDINNELPENSVETYNLSSETELINIDGQDNINELPENTVETSNVPSETELMNITDQDNKNELPENELQPPNISSETAIIDIDDQDIINELPENEIQDNNNYQNDPENKQEDFAPSIDIDLSLDEKKQQDNNNQKPTISLEEIEKQLQDKNIMEPFIEMTDKENKKTLLIASSVIILILVAIYFVLSSGFLSNKNNIPKGPITLLQVDTTITNNLTYQKGEKKPLTGFIISKWKNTNIKEKTEYKKGLKNGNYEKHFANNKIEEKGTFLNNRKNNIWKKYNKDNNIVLETNYKSGKKNGLERKWDKDNNIISSKTFINDIEKTGKTFTYFPDSNKLKEEIIFKNGLVNYKKIWNLDGNRLIDGIITNKTSQKKLTIGKRTNIYYDVNDIQFTILSNGTTGNVKLIDNQELLFNIEITDNVKKKAKIIYIQNDKKNILIEKEKVYIQFVVFKKKKEVLNSDNSKKNKSKEKINKENLQNNEKIKKKNLKNELDSQKEKNNEDSKTEKIIQKNKTIPNKVDKSKTENKNKMDELTKAKLIENKKLEDEKNNKIFEKENKRIDDAKQAKIEEEKKRNGLKEGDEVSNVDTPPVPINTDIPKLSKKLRKKIKGNYVQLTISLLIDENGNVKRIKRIVKSGIPEIDLEISRIVMNWKFKPATKYDKKVKTWYTKLIKLKK